MRTDLNTYLHYFCVVAEQQSFTQAGLQLGLSPSAVSQAVNLLEKRLGLKLLYRNTRSIRLTEAGEQLLNRVKPTLEEINNALEDIQQQHSMPKGVIRITTSYIAWKALIYPKLSTFTEQYPAIDLDIQINDGLNDIIKEGFDIGIRSTRSLQDSMVALPLGNPVKSHLVASPDYLSKTKRPMTPEDLYQHETIGYRFPSSQQVYNWTFTKEGEQKSLQLPHTFIVNNETLLLELALLGKGFAYVFEQEAINNAIANKQLICTLEDWQLECSQYYLYYPNRKFIPSKLRAFIDFYRST